MHLGRAVDSDGADRILMADLGFIPITRMAYYICVVGCYQPGGVLMQHCWLL